MKEKLSYNTISQESKNSSATTTPGIVAQGDPFRFSKDVLLLPSALENSLGTMP